MRSRIALAGLLILMLALVGVAAGRAQSLAEQARLLLLYPQQYQALHPKPEKRVDPPQTIPDWAPPGVELAGKNGVTNPQVLHQVKPLYTSDAMRAKIQGDVVLHCIVEKDGSVGEVRVVSSLDQVHGLDDEAVRAAKKWRFAPATKNGHAVPVLVSIGLTFTLR
jgi:protein TonB